MDATFGPNPLLALRALAEDAVRVELVAPEPEFVDRPLATGTPSVVTQVQRRPLAEIAADRRAALRVAALEHVDGENTTEMCVSRTSTSRGRCG